MLRLTHRRLCREHRFIQQSLAFAARFLADGVRFRARVVYELARGVLRGVQRIDQRLLACVIPFNQLFHGIDSRFQQRDSLKPLFEKLLHLFAIHSSTSSFSCCVSQGYPRCAYPAGITIRPRGVRAMNPSRSK